MMRARLVANVLSLMALSSMGIMIPPSTASIALENVRFALHRKGPFVPSKGSSICFSYSPNAERTPCVDYTVVGPAPGGSTVYLVAGQGGMEGIAGFSCGIDYSGREGQDTGIAFVTWTSCLDAEFPSDGDFGEWPNPKSGNRMVWMYESNCQRDVIGSSGVHAVAGAFYVYAYSEDVLELTPNNNLVSGPELAVVNCDLHELDLLDLYSPSLICGKVHLGGDGSQGYTPCTMGVAEIQASDAVIEPGALNTNSNGRWIKAVLELPEPYSLQDMILSTISAFGVPADSSFFESGDFNENGVPDGAVRFSRPALLQHVSSESGVVEVPIRGDLHDGRSFVAKPALRLVQPHVLYPQPGDVLVAGSFQAITWEVPSSWRIERSEVFYSLDRGRSWTSAGTSASGREFTWRVPEEVTDKALAMVVLYDDFGLLGSDKTDGVFSISRQNSVRETGPDEHLLIWNSPNPFSKGTMIHYVLRQDASMALGIIDIQGRVVRTLVDGWMPKGPHEIYWDGRDEFGRALSDGIYFYNMKAAGEDQTGRMLQIRNH